MKAILLVSALLLYAPPTPAGPISGAGPARLSPSRPALEIPVAALDRSAGDRFVQVAIVRIANPEAYSLSFEVHYHPPEGEAVYLGAFAPFPATEPGRHIVPTRGLVGPEGHVVVSLDLADDDPVPAVLEVCIGEVKFTDNHP